MGRGRSVKYRASTGNLHSAALYKGWDWTKERHHKLMKRLRNICYIDTDPSPTKFPFLPGKILALWKPWLSSREGEGSIHVFVIRCR